MSISELDFYKIITSKKFVVTVVVFMYILLFLVSITNINESSYHNDGLDQETTNNINITDYNSLLYNAATNEDFDYIINRIQDFITQQNGSPTSEVIVKNAQYPNETSTIYSFFIDIPELNISNLEFQYDFSAEPVMFTIPSKNYSVPFYGYGVY